MIIGPNGPASHSSILPIFDWYTRYIFQVIEKIQTENIKAVEPKKEAIRDLYNHTHELMKRLVWSSACRKCPCHTSWTRSLTVAFIRKLVQERQDTWPGNGDIPGQSTAFLRADEECAVGGLQHHLSF